MTLNKLVSLVAKREGKKHEASVGDVREILKIIIDEAARDMVGAQDGAWKALATAIDEKAKKLKAKPVKKAKKK